MSGVSIVQTSPPYGPRRSHCGSHHHQGVAVLYCVLTLLKTHASVGQGETDLYIFSVDLDLGPRFAIRDKTKLIKILISVKN